MENNKLFPRSGSSALRQASHIHKKGHSFLILIYIDKAETSALSKTNNQTLICNMYQESYESKVESFSICK